MNMPDEPQAVEPSRPFVVPCAQLKWNAPLKWLALGWSDLRRASTLSLGFGALIAVISALVSALAWSLGKFALLAALLSGFVFVAPLLGVGLYSISRDLEAGRQPSLARSLAQSRRVLGHAGVFALVQLVILLVWSRAGMMINIFLPMDGFEGHSLFEFLLIGSAVGSIFASLTFATAVLSLPMIADRDVDMVTACVSSIHAVLRNKPAMLVWITLIVTLTGIGFLTAFLGLIVILPWLAHASWHAYRETLDASAWPSVESPVADSP